MDVLRTLSTRVDYLKSAHQELWHTRERLNEAERILAAAEARHTLAGLEGKNEAARKAELATLTESETAEVVTADKAHRQAQLVLTLADLDYKLAREAAALHRAQLLASAPVEAVA